MNYRADIDGLRAVAVLLVLVFHGGLSFFQSGFIGVDIFFVISGFLITSIIHESLKNNAFSLSDFYNRRLWRLQPVLLCLIFITTLLTLLFYLPDDLMEYTRSARKTSLFLSNIYFKNTTTGYFSPDTHQLPLLHTWSLSIEWQCYLILPVVIYGLNRLFGPRYIHLAIYTLTALFFALSVYESVNHPAQTYYFLASRVFEFLIGSCTALSPFKRIALNKTCLNIVGILALISLFYVASKNDIILGYPNYYALAVCLSTAAIILLGKYNPHNYATQLLSIRPLVFIGVLSYSLYIWHWVVFSLIRYQNTPETPQALLVAYLVIFIFSYLSWRFIEKPSRKLNRIKFQYTVASLVILPIVATHLSSSFIKQHIGFPQRFNQELVMIYQQLNQAQIAKRSKCIDHDETNHTKDCQLGSQHPNSKTGLMIGDSFSNHYWGFMDVLGKAANVSLRAEATSSCITLPGIYLYNWWHFKNQVYADCHRRTASYYEMIKANHYDYVIIGQIWPNYLGDNIINQLNDERSRLLTLARLEIALDKALQIISDSGAKPVLVKHSAVMSTNAHDCFFKHIKHRETYHAEQCAFDLTVTEDDHWLSSVFDKMGKKYPELIVIDPKRIQCPHNRCHVDINGIPVYRDVGHLTDYASLQLGQLYLKQNGNPFHS